MLIDFFIENSIDQIIDYDYEKMYNQISIDNTYEHSGLLHLLSIFQYIILERNNEKESNLLTNFRMMLSNEDVILTKGDLLYIIAHLEKLKHTITNKKKSSVENLTMYS